MKSEWFDPHKSFLSLKVVWLTVLSLSSLSIICALIIILNSQLELDLSFTGFNFFISIFRFPLAIAALIIPLVALLAANHRSEQTKEQIKVTNAQNVFSNYYKHIEEFTKYLKNRADSQVDLRFAHSNTYPNSSIGDYSLDLELMSLISRLDNVSNDILENYPEDYNQGFPPEILKSYYDLIHGIYAFFYRDRDDYRSYVTYNGIEQYGKSYLSNALSLIKHCQTAVRCADQYCKFTVDYKSPAHKLNSKLLKLDSIYVFQKPDKARILNFSPNMTEQTFEEANKQFIKMLKSTVADS